MITYKQQIQKRVESGENFSNELSGWFTINRQSENLRMICINDENRFYKNNSTYTDSIIKLLNGKM